MITAGLTLAALASALHIYIFYMESIAWTSPRVRATFGTSEEEANATKEMALNQGFYNLFLALVALIGTALTWLGPTGPGLALAFAGTGSMLAAALVLFITSPSKRAAAVKQGTLPLLAVVALLVGVIS